MAAVAVKNYTFIAFNYFWGWVESWITILLLIFHFFWVLIAIIWIQQFSLVKSQKRSQDFFQTGQIEEIIPEKGKLEKNPKT